MRGTIKCNSWTNDTKSTTQFNLPPYASSMYVRYKVNVSDNQVYILKDAISGIRADDYKPLVSQMIFDP